MAMYLLKRLGQTIIVLLIVCVATFFMVDLVPGDPVYTVAGTSDLEAEEYDAIYHQLNLDKSTAERFLIWVRDALHGDFGTSYSYSMPVIFIQDYAHDSGFEYNTYLPEVTWVEAH